MRFWRPFAEGYPYPVLHACMECTLAHLGGTLTESGGRFHQIDMLTNLCGKVTIGVAVKPSKADAFRELGCRVWIRGIGDKQRELARVRAWLGALSEMLTF